jgi:Na+/glutamate symporter
MVSVYLYLMMSLTDFHGENLVRSEIGYVLLFLVVFTVMVNFFKALWFTIMGLKYTKKLLHSFKRRRTTPHKVSDSSPIQPPHSLKPT